MNTKNIKDDIPQQLQAKLFDHTGSKDGGNKGFVCFYVNGEGMVSVLQKVESGVVNLALRKFIELYLEEE